MILHFLKSSLFDFTFFSLIFFCSSVCLPFSTRLLCSFPWQWLLPALISSLLVAFFSLQFMIWTNIVQLKFIMPAIYAWFYMVTGVQVYHDLTLFCFSQWFLYFVPHQHQTPILQNMLGVHSTYTYSDTSAWKLPMLLLNSTFHIVSVWMLFLLRLPWLIQ